jgi:response regulator NasT
VTAREHPDVALERAKGILMERHAVEEDKAFSMLRDHGRGTNTTLVDTAQAVVDGRLLLPESL